MENKPGMKKVLVVGEQDRLVEFSQLNLKNADLEFLDQLDSELNRGHKNSVWEMLSHLNEDADNDDFTDVFDDVDWDEIEVVIDLGLDENPQNLFNYAEHSHLIVIGCSVKNSLASMADEMPTDMRCWLFGMNSIPTFINRPIWEISSYKEKEKPLLEAILKDFGIEFEWVEDRVGMATPRIVSMIINEAFFMHGEGTAEKNDIDLAMKLGTNYPYGPFEWAEKMGLYNVIDILEKVYQDTMDSRYKVSPELKKEYYKSL